jgi:ribonuclease Z
MVDTSYYAQNAAKIIDLAHEADIEAVFLDEDREIAAHKRHLTAPQAGSLARRAGVNRVVPFHFSPRYRDREDCLRREVEDAFVGRINAEGAIRPRPPRTGPQVLPELVNGVALR